MRSFEEYRQLAIDILQPSPRDLEHGLELHKNSFVFDAYGFMPRAAARPLAEELISAGASREELTWRREEYTMDSAFDDPEMVQKLKEITAIANHLQHWHSKSLQTHLLENYVSLEYILEH